MIKMEHFNFSSKLMLIYQNVPFFVLHNNFFGPITRITKRRPIFAMAGTAHTTLDLPLKFPWVYDTFPSTKPSPRLKILPRIWISYLKGFFASVDQLVPFQLWTLHKCFPTFSTHMNPGSMSVKVFPHCWLITKHLGASLVWACYCPFHSITHLFLHFHLVTRSRIVKYTTCITYTATLYILRHATTQNICRYTLSNKNPSAWNFLSPELEVTCGTAAIIIRVILLSPYLQHSWRFSVFHSLQSITPRIY